MPSSLTLFEVGVVVVSGLVAPLQEGPRLGMALQIEPPGRQFVLVVGLHRQLARHVRSDLFRWVKGRLVTTYSHKFQVAVLLGYCEKLLIVTDLRYTPHAP